MESQSVSGVPGNVAGRIAKSRVWARSVCNDVTVTSSHWHSLEFLNLHGLQLTPRFDFPTRTIRYGQIAVLHLPPVQTFKLSLMSISRCGVSFGNLLRVGASRIKSALVSSPSIQTRSNYTLSEENLARYCPGGYHPVRIGDRFSNGKYEVISKLGYGLYSTVWLARDIG